MQHQILVPLDGSSQAEAILPHSITLAQLKNTMLTLLRVIPATKLESVYVTDNPEFNKKIILTSAHNYLTGIEEQLRAKNLHVETMVLEGDPATQILSYNEQNKSVSMIMMKKSHEDSEHYLSLQSVFSRVLQLSSVPLFMVPFHEKGRTSSSIVPYRAISVPLDGSAYAELALDKARHLAHSLHARLVLLSVVPALDDSKTNEGEDYSLHAASFSQEEIERRTHYLAHKARQLHEEGLMVETEVAYGQAAQEIMRICTEQDISLMVLSSHGRGSSHPHLLGHVAMELMQCARLPVVLIPTKKSEARNKIVLGRDKPWSSQISGKTLSSGDGG